MLVCNGSNNRFLLYPLLLVTCDCICTFYQAALIRVKKIPLAQVCGSDFHYGFLTA